MKIFLFFFLAFSIVILDQATKVLTRSFILPTDVIPVLPFLHLVHVVNEGGAFGMFKGFGTVPFIIVSTLAIAVVTYLLVRGRENKWGLSLILGGAIGNLIDRMLFGKVTDFIDIFAGRFHWPAFNVADSALTVGLFIIVISSLFSRSEQQAL